MDIEQMESLCKAFNAHAHGGVQDIDAHLRYADQELGTYGVEGVTLEGDVYPVILYCNNGETYSPTIVYNVSEDTFYVSSWGDALEDMETRRANGDI